MLRLSHVTRPRHISVFTLPQHPAQELITFSLPSPYAQESPRSAGDEITKFLETYFDLASFRGLKGKLFCQKVKYYMEKLQKDLVEALGEETEDWEAFCKLHRR
jgi:hypothetical protein